MKSFGIARFTGALVVGLLGMQSLALACPHNQQMFMCPGDPVVDSGGTSGTVKAINPFKHTVSMYEPAYGRNYEYSIEQVALGVGCLEGYCVGDSVVDSGGTSGKIVAVNPYNRQIAMYEPAYGRNYLYSIDQVSLGLGCMEGYCVGDQVVDSGGTNGTIVGINRANGQAAVYEPSYGRNYVYGIRTLGSTNFCTTYGDMERAVRVYPEMRVEMYITTELHFTLTRPIR